MCRNAYPLIALAVWLVAGRGMAQVPAPRVQLRADAGVFSPLGDDLKNTYNSGPILQLALVTPLSAQSRLELGYSRLVLSGNPFVELTDLILSKGGTMRLHGLSMLLEFTGKVENNPKVYVGAGAIYEFGSEKIVGNNSNRGDGLGLLFTLSPEFQLSRSLFVTAEAGLRLLEVTFKGNGRIPYTFNLSGGSLSAGIAYRFGQPNK